MNKPVTKTKPFQVLASLFAMLGLAATSATASAEITGVPGSPSATTTIDGKQLPPTPDSAFHGTIKSNALDSTPYWPPRITPGKDAPNILLILTDDAGYGVSSTFGGVIPTPAMERVAQNGLRYTHFHSTSVCSPGATITKWAMAQFLSYQQAIPATMR